MAIRLTRRRIVLLSVAALLLAALGTGGWYAWGEWRARRELAEGRDELARFQYESACAHIEKAAAHWPGRGEVRLEAARSCRRARSFEAAKSHLRAARSLLGDTEDVRLEQLLLAAQRGEASEFVEDSLHQRAGHDPGNRALILEALTDGSRAAFRLHRARAAANEWLSEPSADPRAYLWRGEIEEEMAHKDQAIADYRRAVELDPGCDEARLRLGEALIGDKDPGGALPHFEEVQRRRPDDVRALVGLAQCRKALGQTEEARGLLDRALELAPNHAEALRERGMLALDAGNAAEAEPLLRRAYAVMPHDPFVAFNFGDCLRKLGQTEEASKLESRHKELVDKLARLRDLLRNEIPKRPKDPELMHEIATLYVEYGRLDQEVVGLWWMQKTLEVDPNHAPTLRYLTEYYERKGMPEVADRFRQRLRGR